MSIKNLLTLYEIYSSCMKSTNPVWKTYKRLRRPVWVIQGVHVFTLNQSFSYIYVGGKILIYTTLIIRIFNQSYTGIQSYLSFFFFFLKCNSILNYQNTKRRYQILPIKKLHTHKKFCFQFSQCVFAFPLLLIFMVFNFLYSKITTYSWSIAKVGIKHKSIINHYSTHILTPLK